MKHNGKDKGGDWMHDAEDKVKEIIEEVKESSKAFMKESLATAQDALEQESKYIKDKYEQIKDKTVSEIGEDVRTYVQRNPMKSMGIAVGAGLLLGFLLKSNRND